jgi:hypothetical protein
METAMDPVISNEEMEKAVEDYLKRQEYNKRWRERNPEKVAAIRHRYNAAKWQRTKAVLAAARAAGKL